MSYYTGDDFDLMDEIIEKLLGEVGISRKGASENGFRIIISGNIPVGSPETGGEEPSDHPPEVHEIDDEVRVVTEVPGAGQEDVHLDISGETLTIEAETGAGRQVTHVALPPVDAASMQYTCRNGVLEVVFKKASDPPVQ